MVHAQGSAQRGVRYIPEIEMLSQKLGDFNKGDGGIVDGREVGSQQG